MPKQGKGFNVGRMVLGRDISRREFLQKGSLAAAAVAAPINLRALSGAPPLEQFGYGDVLLAPGMHEDQLRETLAVLMGLDEDALLKPFRQMAGKPAPGPELLGWYCYRPEFNYKGDTDGFAPGHSFGQWVSALSRAYAITRDPKMGEKVRRMNRLLADAISEDYFERTRFPAYSYDKLVCGLVDSHEFVTDPDAFSVLEQVTAVALPHLPARAVPRESVWQPGKDVSYTWDESYTLPENLFLAYRRGAGAKYRDLASRYLMDEGYFDQLSMGENVLNRKHAYSYVNAMSSAMQAYLTLGSEKHLQAAKNGFEMLVAQSYATGGWGPDELLQGADSDALFASLSGSHNSFETPCGSYAHFKLTRYLLCVTRDSRYGDSLEGVMYNTVLGARQLQPDGHAFYYSDYNAEGTRVYSRHIWPCCSGTLPQVAADYRISAYFRDGRDIYVNLYIPSTLRWTQDGNDLSLASEGNYPLGDTVQITLTLSHSEKFSLLLRIPDWAEGASVQVNGKSSSGPIQAGSFLRLQRKWKTGDRIALTLPMQLRLEPICPRHPESVALVRGPLVLFPLGTMKTAFAQKQLLSARQDGPSQWLVESDAGPVRFAPYTALGTHKYSTYVRSA